MAEKALKGEIKKQVKSKKEEGSSDIKSRYRSKEETINRSTALMHFKAERDGR